jgi:transcriptional regulator with XRE-family HTH domain
MATELAYVNGDVLRCARETSGYTVADAAEKLGLRTTDLRLVEEGGDWLTYRQAENAAATYRRSLATFFASAPPEEPPVEVQFGRLRDAPELPWPPAVHHLNRRIARRQAALREIYEGFDEAPPWTSHALRLSHTPLNGLASAARELLGITIAQQREQNDQYAVLRCWVDAVERLGIFCGATVSPAKSSFPQPG